MSRKESKPFQTLRPSCWLRPGQGEGLGGQPTGRGNGRPGRATPSSSMAHGFLSPDGHLRPLLPRQGGQCVSGQPLSSNPLDREVMQCWFAPGSSRCRPSDFQPGSTSVAHATREFQPVSRCRGEGYEDFWEPSARPLGSSGKKFVGGEKFSSPAPDVRGPVTRMQTSPEMTHPVEGHFPAAG